MNKTNLPSLPWRAVGDVVAGADGRVIADIGRVRPSATTADREANRATARFIAAAPETARRLEELALAADDILAELSDGLRAVSVVERAAAAGRLRAALKRARGGE